MSEFFVPLLFVPLTQPSVITSYRWGNGVFSHRPGLHLSLRPSTNGVAVIGEKTHIVRIVGIEASSFHSFIHQQWWFSPSRSTVYWPQPGEWKIGRTLWKVLQLKWNGFACYASELLWLQDRYSLVGIKDEDSWYIIWLNKLSRFTLYPASVFIHSSISGNYIQLEHLIGTFGENV